MKRALLVCVLAGCGSTDIDRDVCGNGIVEVGEDCDSLTDMRCIECGVSCGVTEDCQAYDPDGMAGFVCGPDAFCHAPSGRFLPVVGFALPAESYRVTDVNGDGFNELLVQSQTSVTAVFDASTAAVNAVSIQTPIPRGNAAFAKVDADGSLDTLLPTTDGIVAYTTRFGTPSPYPFPSPIAASIGNPLFSHAITPTSPLRNDLGMIGTFPGDPTKLFYIVIDVTLQPPTFVGQVELCGGKVGDLDTSEVQVFETQPQHEIVAVTLRPPGQPAHACVVTADFNGATYTVNTVVFAPTAEPKSRPVLANLRGGFCPSLVLAQGAGQVVEYQPSGVANPCDFQDTPTVSNAPIGSVPIGTVELKPAIGGRTVGLALSTGIYDPIAAGTLNLVELYRSDRALFNVQAADVDNDGDVDVVASSKNSEDLDILDRKPGSFLRFRFDTAAPVGQFLLGDFDGNELIDIAYVEEDLSEQRLQIAYGTSDQFLPGVNMGTFSKIRAIVPGSIPDSTDPDFLIADLAVLFEEEVVDETTLEVTIVPAITLLHGSPQRTMLAFFDPRQPPLAPQSQFRGVVAGSFSGPGSNGNDVLALEQAGTLTRVYLSIGATNGELQSGDSNDAANIADCKAGADPMSSSLCIDDAHFLAWSIEDSHDLVVAVDSNLEVAAFDPRTLGGGAPVIMKRWSNTIVAPVRSTVRKVQRVILGDSSPRLLISLGPALGAPDPRATGAVNLCTFDENAGPVCQNLSEHVTTAVGAQFGAQTCVDAGVAHVAGASRFNAPDSSSPDIVVLCRSGDVFSDALFRLSFDGDVLRDNVELIDFVTADAIEIGDVSGDGIDDIITLERTSLIPIMTVYRQCNSRDVDCGVVAALGEEERP